MPPIRQVAGLVLGCAAVLAAIMSNNRVAAEDAIPRTNLDLALKAVGPSF